MSEVDSTTNPEDPLVGTTVNGKYKVVRLCGRGGMGSVYEAQNVAIGKKVALKFIDPGAASNADAVQRFLREAQAASAAESLHIVQVFDVGETPEGLAYIVMELLRGENLGQRLARVGRLPISETVHIAVHTLRGLRKAHEMGIVHRDLKPENIFLVETDDDPIFAKVVDFGVSKILRRSTSLLEPGTLTREGVVLGTPHYMAPEQAQGMPDLDARTDLWAVGAILYECLTGERPHKGKTYEQVIVAICTNDVPDVRTLEPSVPLRLAEVIRRALTRDRTLRIQTAAEFLEGLREAAPELVSSNPSFDPALEATVALKTPLQPVAAKPELGSGGRTRVSWATGESGKSTAVRAQGSRARWRVALLGAFTMFAAFALTLVMMRRANPPKEQDPRSGKASTTAVASAASSSPVLQTLELRVLHSPTTAQVFVDDRLAADDMIRGPRGASFRVRVDAEGYRTAERTVLLDGSAVQLSVELEALVDAAPVADPRKVKTAQPSTKPTGTAPVATGTPKTPGVAGELKLKTDGP